MAEMASAGATSAGSIAAVNSGPKRGKKRRKKKTEVVKS
tara:strand:- start:1402 stop:1518 length:117 start_codon:yes stop_codon:yes gene_type:complete